MSRLCRDCKHFDNDPLTLEDIFKGINILSSVHGCSRGDAGLCLLHDLYLLPCHSCRDFEEMGAIVRETGQAGRALQNLEKRQL